LGILLPTPALRIPTKPLNKALPIAKRREMSAIF